MEENPLKIVFETINKLDYVLQVPWAGVITNYSTSPFAEEVYDKIKEMLNEYEVIINRWPQYTLILENVSYMMIYASSQSTNLYALLTIGLGSGETSLFS